MELNGDRTGRLALMEELKMLPFAAVWNRYCEMQGVPVGAAWLQRGPRLRAQHPFRALRYAFSGPPSLEAGKFLPTPRPPGKGGRALASGRPPFQERFHHPRPNGLSGHAPRLRAAISARSVTAVSGMTKPAIARV